MEGFEGIQEVNSKVLSIQNNIIVRKEQKVWTFINTFFLLLDGDI
jgi:hypothetical protein